MANIDSIRLNAGLRAAFRAYRVWRHAYDFRYGVSIVVVGGGDNQLHHRLVGDGFALIAGNGSGCNFLFNLYFAEGSFRVKMSQRKKLIERFRTRPRDFTWNELTTLLESLGYKRASSGKTGGSRFRFVHEQAPTISLHKPHPGNIVKRYVLKEILDILTREKLLE